ncbi:carboxypeptidase [Nibricoccus aquaticus]|uniref:Metal-dependent carboxypeptidase n=1 Tax=Nibricoccus aquaticus TaxID=2576891 RepID=A0A290Q7P5_9BACT|nr:carboxypeptidase M32 [Nibricoccus aquaticus]ATC64524.1 carboxypeptidase [Nibricoccus aquaticus]
MTNTTDAFSELNTRLRRAQLLDSIGQLLGWDEQVNLPADSVAHRAAQHAALAETAHAALSDPKIGELLAVLEAQVKTLTSDQQIVVRWARRDYDRATKLPAEFVREKAEQGSRGYHAWAEAKKNADFASYAPVLEKNLELAKREAGYLGQAAAPYDYMIDKHDPGMSAAVIEKLFDELKAGLVPFVREVTASKTKARADLMRGFPVEQQRAFLREVTQKIGFNYERGRIDVSLHPFCSGTGADIRMTTRFDADNPLDSLFSSIHETGHGLYEQGLASDQHHTALGQAAGMGVHESQSRLWENQVARSRGFWKFFEPKFRTAFSEQLKDVSSDEFYLAINAVEPTLIRVDADEVTYNLHVVLRFELEKKLFAGTLAVRDLPKAWNESAQALLGLTPANDREGVLQDVHWSDGAFGYFPSYCIGNMMAAQLWYHALSLRPQLEEEFARGDFTWLLGWLREMIHAQGKRLDTLGLVRHATGEELSPKWLLRYLRERYGALYLK